MSDENEIKQMNKNAILIHQLPVENVEEVLEYFPSEWILNYFHNNEGLHIYFHDANRVIECALHRVIEVKGHLFNIYLKVTNLTVHGVAAYTRDVKTLMEYNGYHDIVDCYAVEELKEHEGHKSFTILSDYRVILNAPEIFANHNLTPVHLPERPSFAFRVTFFCRLCRQNDHKAFQCPKAFQSDSVASNFVLDRKISHENYSSSFKASKMRHCNQPSTASCRNEHEAPHVLPRCSASGSSQSFSKPHLRSLKLELHLSSEDDDSEDTRHEAESPLSEESKSQSSLQRQTSLCEAIEEAISKTAGVLLPDLLIQFLNQVRGRKNKALMEITRVFTTEISGLIQQLKLVKKNYLTLVKSRNRSDEDRDLRFLKNLRRRLKGQINMREHEADSSYYRASTNNQKEG